jgi:multimeric flavodoxin WrbA
MSNKLSRRHLLNSTILAAGAAAVAEFALNPQPSSAQAVPAGKIKIIALNGSPRKDKTTAASLTVAMKAAQSVAPDRIGIELIHLVDYNLFSSAQILGGLAIPTIRGKTDFVKLEEKLSVPEVRGILVGSPAYKGSPSPLVTLFFCQIRHGNDKNGYPILEGKPVGALAVGNGRNGGQEKVVNDINTYCLREKMILVGIDHSGIGALLWNQKDSIDADEFGKKRAEMLGQRVAKTALSAPKNLLAQLTIAGSLC